MEKKILQFKTKCPFPILRYQPKVTYNEVRKASGVAYILLDLINSRDSFGEEKLSDVLSSFGIPSDLHHIFGKEASGLIERGILESCYRPDYFLEPKYFSEIGINQVSMTEKGRKLFKEGAIPTGEEKGKQAEVLYSPVDRNFVLGNKTYYNPLSSSFLGEGFMDKVEVDISGLQEYLSSNKTKIGLKKEELIVNVEPGEPEKLQVRKEDGMTITISDEGVDFSFQTSNEKAFFYRYYSCSLMSEGMRMKNKYKFIDASGNQVSLPYMDLWEIDKAYIPDEAKRLAGSKCEIFLKRGRIPVFGNKEAVELQNELANRILDMLGEKAEFALMDKRKFIYYSPVNVSMKNHTFEDRFEMQMLVEKEAEEEVYRRVLFEILNEYSSYPFAKENGRMISFMENALPGDGILRGYVEKKMEEYSLVEEKASLLLEMDGPFSRCSSWKSILEEKGKALIEQTISETELDDAAFKREALEPLKRKLNITDADFARMFVDALQGKGDDELVFQSLEAAGFSSKEIVPLINLVAPYMEMVLSNSQIDSPIAFSSPFNVLRINLWKLNEMLGIKRYDNYTIKEDFIGESFFDAYSTLDSTYRQLKSYREFAKERFAEFDRYLDIYKPVHEVLARERDSSSHPERLSEEYVDRSISRGNYKDAICDLGVKLQYELAKILGAREEKADKLIDLAREKGIIEEDEKNDLHKLRQRRNDFLHPGFRDTEYGFDILMRWKSLVFALSKRRESK